MVQFNFGERTIKAKIVYYGPAPVREDDEPRADPPITDPDGANRLISLNTAQDRTLFFDLLPFSLGSVSGYDFKVQLYTVPGQVQYNATRRVVLAGADGVVFVADSQKAMATREPDRLREHEGEPSRRPARPREGAARRPVQQAGPRGTAARGEMDRTLNFWGRKAFPAVAARGDGVMPTFVAIVQEMLAAIAVKYNLKDKGLDPDAVPEIVAQAFDALLRAKPAPRPARRPPRRRPHARVVIAQPDDAEPAYPSHAGPEANPVSEELLHRAIRSNVSLAETLGQLVRDFSIGLATIQVHVEHARLRRPGHTRDGRGHPPRDRTPASGPPGSGSQRPPVDRHPPRLLTGRATARRPAAGGRSGRCALARRPGRADAGAGPCRGAPTACCLGPAGASSPPHPPPRAQRALRHAGRAPHRQSS